MKVTQTVCPDPALGLRCTQRPLLPLRASVFTALFLLLSGLTLFAQQAPPSPALISDASQRSLQEKIYLRTDKSFYLAGEILWLRMYCMESTTHALLDVSKVAYTELLDPQNKPVVQAKIGLEKGEGSGSLYLPATLASGSYVLRSYTNLMKNRGAAAFFERTITIVNALRPTSADIPDTNFLQADFFPEGGQLVSGVPGRVGFRVQDQSGRGVAAAGVIVNQQHDTVARFEPYLFGLGSFLLTPRAGDRYEALVRYGGSTLRKALPLAQATGYTLALEQLPGEVVRLTARTSGIPAGATLTLVASNRQKTLAARPASLSGDSLSFQFRSSELPEGITVFTLFDARQQPVAERLYFRRPQAGLNIRASTEANVYGTRKKIALTVATADAAAHQLPASLSVSVYLLDTLQAPDQQNLVNYTWLSSELSGQPESPDYYFTHDDARATDNLLLTHGWRKFRQPAAPVFSPEYYGHIVTARVLNATTGMPEKDVETYLSVPGNYPRFYVQKSNDSGIVRFDVKGYYGAGEVVVQTQSADNSAYRVEISSPFWEEAPVAAHPMLQVVPAFAGQLAERSIGMQVQHVFAEDSITRFQVPVTDSLPFYGRPDHEYLLDNYTRFVTMEEVLREYVREINVRNRGGSLEMVMLDEPHRDFFNGNLLVLMDGVPVFDQSKIFSYDPLKVKKLDVVSTQYFIGYYAFNGIASFTTYKGELEGFQLDPKALVVDYDGLQLQREFYAPSYGTEKAQASRLPDFRTLLQWSPALRTDARGEAALSFYASDLKGRYLVVVEGMTPDGKMGSTSFPIDIR